MELALCAAAEPLWNRFVRSASGASVFHLYEWKTIIERTYRHQAFYLIAREGDRVAGVLPLFFLESRLFGRTLVSMPFADYGGICGDASKEAARLLLEEALRLGRSVSADYLLLRQTPSEGPTEPGFPGLETYAGKVTMLFDLNPDTDLIWKGLHSERRNRIRKARKAGLSTRWGDAHDLDEFYDVFSENMRDLGSPVHSKRLFSETLALLGESAKLLLVESGKKVIGAAVCLFFRETILVPWVAARRPYFSLHPNMLLYWAAIEYGCEHNYKILDFGRSSLDSGTYEFKRQWGARPCPLPWQVFSFRPKARPMFSPGTKERLLAACWRRLPVAVTRQIGPRLRRSIQA